MKDYLEKLVDAAENFIESVDNETILAYEAGKDIFTCPSHSKEYYLCLQEMRKMIREYRAFQERT